MLVTKLIPATNFLLASLSRKERQNFLVFCERITLAFSQNLDESSKHVRHVYFPTSSSLSFVVAIDSHSNMKAGLVNNERMVGRNLCDWYPFFIAVYLSSGLNLHVPKA